MDTKIKAVTVVNQQGTRCYAIGNTYNGLLLDHIKDLTIEYPDMMTVIYSGFTKDDKLVFEVINAPIDVEYGEEA